MRRLNSLVGSLFHHFDDFVRRRLGSRPFVEGDIILKCPREDILLNFKWLVGVCVRRRSYN